MAENKRETDTAELLPHEVVLETVSTVEETARKTLESVCGKIDRLTGGGTLDSVEKTTNVEVTNFSGSFGEIMACLEITKSCLHDIDSIVSGV